MVLKTQSWQEMATSNKEIKTVNDLTINDIGNAFGCNVVLGLKGTDLIIKGGY